MLLKCLETVASRTKCKWKIGECE